MSPDAAISSSHETLQHSTSHSCWMTDLSLLCVPSTQPKYSYMSSAAVTSNNNNNNNKNKNVPKEKEKENWSCEHDM